MQWPRVYSVDSNRTAEAAELMQKGAFQNREDAFTEIFEYIEMYYNKKRRHSSIDYETPQFFEVKWEQKINK